MITGAPKRGVTALIGIMMLVGKTHAILHRTAINAPHRMVAGSSVRWSEVRQMSLAMCGTASPMNVIGPQKAVATAVSSPVESNRARRVRLMFMPRLVAYSSPNCMILSGLISRIAMQRLMRLTPANHGRCAKLTFEKLPRPHIVKLWTSSTSAKK